MSEARINVRVRIDQSLVVGLRRAVGSLRKLARTLRRRPHRASGGNAHQRRVNARKAVAIADAKDKLLKKGVIIEGRSK